MRTVHAVLSGAAYRRAQSCALDIMWQTGAKIGINEANMYVLAAIDDGKLYAEVGEFELHIDHYPNESDRKFVVWLDREEESVTVTVERQVVVTYHDTYTLPRSVADKMPADPGEVPAAIRDAGFEMNSDDPINTNETILGVDYE